MIVEDERWPLHQGTVGRGCRGVVIRPACEPDQARPGTDSAIFHLGPEGVPAGSSGWAVAAGGKMWAATTRNPLFLFLLFGLFLLRAAQRTLFSLLLNEPPRNTRHL